MNYAILKFHFSTAVHFGDGVLNSSVTSFMADTLFSSLFIESLKMNMNQQLLDYVNSGKLLFSDSFPFKGKEYFLPKPIMAVRNEDSENQKMKKKVKKIKYLPCDKVDDFVNSKLDFEKYADVKFCRLDEDTKAAVRNAEKEEPLPYRVGVCTFMENCGLYVIAGYENPSTFEEVKTLFDSLQYTGIGGKRNGGLGRFTLEITTIWLLVFHIRRMMNWIMLLTVLLIFWLRDPDLYCRIPSLKNSEEKKTDLCSRQDRVSVTSMKVLYLMLQPATDFIRSTAMQNLCL